MVWVTTRCIRPSQLSAVPNGWEQTAGRHAKMPQPVVCRQAQDVKGLTHPHSPWVTVVCLPALAGSRVLGSFSLYPASFSFVVQASGWEIIPCVWLCAMRSLVGDEKLEFPTFLCPERQQGRLLLKLRHQSPRNFSSSYKDLTALPNIPGISN